MPSRSDAADAAEIAALRREVDELRAFISGLSEQSTNAVGMMEMFRQRVEALEKRFSAMEARMTHIDTMLMELQGEVRRMTRSIENLSRDQGTALTELRGMMLRMLELAQPKVTLPEPPVNGG